jgi:hypothetical protein
MTLFEQVKQDLKEAMQNKDAEKTSVLRMLLSALSSKEKTKQADLTDEEAVEVISSEAKKIKDSINQYREGGREDLAEKEEKDLKVLEKYLPEQMSEDEIREKVKAKIGEVGAESPQEAGKVMGPLMSEFKGKADGGLVKKILEEELRK